MGDTTREKSVTTPSQVVTSTGCCPPFDPRPWEGRRLVWRNKTFLREHVHTFLHVPLDMGRKMKHAAELIEAAHVAPPQRLALADDASPWRSEIYVDITGPVPDGEMESLSGTFLTRVFDGPYRDAPTWMEEMKRWVVAQGHEVEHLYFGYTSCPACAKAYGHNYVVLFARIGPPPPLAPAS